MYEQLKSLTFEFGICGSQAWYIIITKWWWYSTKLIDTNDLTKHLKAIFWGTLCLTKDMSWYSELP